jgi:hypothetical protein
MKQPTPKIAADGPREVIQLKCAKVSTKFLQNALSLGHHSGCIAHVMHPISQQFRKKKDYKHCDICKSARLTNDGRRDR